MQCGNTVCPGSSGNRSLALTKEGAQAPTFEAHPTTPIYFRGLNFAGGQAWDLGINTNTNPGQYGDTFDYWYPTTEEPTTHDGLNSFQYLAQQGVTHVRLGIRWERIQRVPGCELNTAELAKYDEAITNAGDASLKVILDLHNYGGYWNSTTGGHDTKGKLALGSPGLGTAEFVDVWHNLSARYAQNPTIVMYDLMNEPSGREGIVPAKDAQGNNMTEGKTWELMTEAVVDDIRTSGDTTDILVPSFEAGVNKTPTEYPGGPWITDHPDLYWGAHHYFDHYDGPGTGGGHYDHTYDWENCVAGGETHATCSTTYK